MNKKAFKFLLYGTLIAASSSTIFSCSNYDDDIKGLQEQITANATDLNSLVNEKINNVGTEIEALKSQQGKLAEAYKAADEEAQKAAIAAAQAAIDTAIEELQDSLDEALKNTGTVENLLLADYNLQIGINDAAALADKAYKLAENKADAKETADALKLIKQVLFGQTDVTSSNASNVLKQIADNKANYTILNAALGELKKSSNKSIDSLANVSTQLKLNIDDCLKDAKKYSDDKIKLLLTDKLMDGGTQIATNTSISNLKLAYAEADKKLGARIDSLAQKTKDSEDTILKIENKLSSISDCLNKSLNNLITNIIIQDTSEIQNVYAKVNQYSINPAEAGKIYFEAGTIKKAYFPYKGAKGAAYLDLDQYNVETEGGKLYVTLNPNTIDFTDSELKLVNSLDNTALEYKLGKAKTSTRTTAVMTRANNVKNGLYSFDVTYNQINKEIAPNTKDKVAYAVMAEYKSYEYDYVTSQKKEINHKIYSKYEISLNATEAKALTNSDIALECNGTELITGNNKVSGLTGTFNMKPAKATPAKDGKKVFKKYLICTNAVKSNGTADQAAKDALNAQANMCTVLGEGDANFDNIPISINEAYNGYIFTINYYIWNYNGSIVKNTYNIIFTQPMIKVQNVTMNSTPVNKSQAVETVIKNSEFSKTLCMNDENNKWKSNTVKAKVEGSSANCPITSIKFYDGTDTPAQKGNTLSINSGVGEITFDVSVASAIKNMTIVYNPANLVIGKEYTFPVRFYDALGNEVNTINVKFTMNRPNVLDSKIVRIPAAFQEDDVTIAWAQYDKVNIGEGKAYYLLSGSYNNLTPNTKTLDAFGSFIRFEDPTKYTSANNKYKPSQEPLFSNGYKMIVPNAAVDAQSKGTNAYLYNMNTGVQYYDFTSIWATTETFKIKFQSPIYHASFTLPKQDCEYRKSLNITNSQISSIDPSFTDLTNKAIYYFGDGQRDNRIENVTVKFANPNDGNNGLFTNVICDINGIHLTTDGTAAITATDVDFIMSVEDKFGCEKEHKFTVRVVPNHLNAQKR